MRSGSPIGWIHRWTLGFVAASMLLFGKPAFAVDEATRTLVRELATEGVHAYQSGDYATARQKLDEAFSMLRTAPLGLWSARALEKSGQLIEASERYLAAERAPLDRDGDQAAQEEARAAASNEREALQARIPRLTVDVEGASASDVTLSVAGRKIPASFIGKGVPVNPGTVEVLAQVGEQTQTTQVDIQEGAHEKVRLAFVPTAATAKAAPTEQEEAGQPGLFARKWPAFAALGVAVAGGVVWGIFGVQSISAKGSADGCVAPACSASDEANYRQQAWDAGNVATVGMVVTGVGLATAGVLWFALPGKESSSAGESVLLRPAVARPRAEIGILPGGLSLRGSF